MGGIDPTFSTIKNQAVISLSYYCYVLCVILYLLLLLISKRKPPSVRETENAQTKDLIGKARNEIANG
jgi:hypothetical protein